MKDNGKWSAQVAKMLEKEIGFVKAQIKMKIQPTSKFLSGLVILNNTQVSDSHC